MGSRRRKLRRLFSWINLVYSVNAARKVTATIAVELTIGLAGARGTLQQRRAASPGRRPGFTPGIERRPAFTRFQLSYGLPRRFMLQSMPRAARVFW